MLTILVLFVGLTLATAVIAYWSDNLGKKLGKKRVSLWGMRPRTTATFLTIASSWLIMIFTLGVLLAIFPPLRQSLLRYDEVKANENNLQVSAKQLTGQVGDLNEQLATLTNQTTTLKGQVTKASAKLTKVSAQLKQSGAAAKRARDARDRARKEADAAKKSADKFRRSEQAAIKRESKASKNLVTVTKQRNATESQRKNAQRELTQAQTELTAASAQVKAADARVKAANARVQKAQGEVTRAEGKLTTVQGELKTVQTNLDAALASEKSAVTNARIALTNAGTARENARKSKLLADEAESRAASASTRAAEAKTQAINAGRKVLEMDGKVRDAQKIVAELEKQGDDLRKANELALTVNKSIANENDYILASDIRVPIGRTLVAQTFEQDISFSDATEGLRALFGRAADKIVPGFLPGARLKLASRPVPLPKVNESDPDEFVIVQEDEIYNNLATAISRSQTPLSVRLVAERNHLEGEKTLNARFIVVPTRPAMAANAELASTTFSQNTSDAQLFSALLKLVEAGREVARQNGVTPPLSPEAPDFYAPGSNEQIFEALRQVSALGDRARVRILTDKAISTTDQLSVRFEVTPLSSTTAQSAARKPAA